MKKNEGSVESMDREGIAHCTKGEEIFRFQLPEKGESATSFPGLKKKKSYFKLKRC